MLDFARYDGLIVVDTQPTAGNVYIPKDFFPDVVIDHHNFREATKISKNIRCKVRLRKYQFYNCGIL